MVMERVDWDAYKRCACSAKSGEACYDLRARYVDKRRTHPHPYRDMKRGARK